MCCAQKSLKNSQNRRLSAKNAEILHEKTKKWALYTKKLESLDPNISYNFIVCFFHLVLSHFYFFLVSLCFLFYKFLAHFLKVTQKTPDDFELHF